MDKCCTIKDVFTNHFTHCAIFLFLKVDLDQDIIQFFSLSLYPADSYPNLKGVWKKKPSLSLNYISYS